MMTRKEGGWREEFNFELIGQRSRRGQGVYFALSRPELYPSFWLAEDSRCPDSIEPGSGPAAVAAVFSSEQGAQLEFWDDDLELKEACLRELFSFEAEGGSGGAKETTILEVAKSWSEEDIELPEAIVIFWQSTKENGYLLEIVCPLDLAPARALEKIRTLARSELSRNN